MKIGIDIDDTITCMSDIYYPMMQKWYLEIQKGNIDNPLFKSRDSKGCILEYTDFWKEFVKNSIFKVNIREGATNIIDKLISEGHEIYIITARSNRDYKNFVNKSIKWLDKKNIHYKETHFNSKGKRQKLIDLGIDVMVDDNEDVMNVANELGVKGILMNTFFNGNYDKCDRAYTWYDVYYYINKYNKEKTEQIVC